MITANDSLAVEEQLVRRIAEGRDRIRKELAKVIRGQEDVIELLLIALLSGGHALITGAPGLAKTLLIQSTARLFHLSFNRIQFTPDLMSADITGTEILGESPDGGRRLEFVRGPIFANLILADEINRTPPKTQSALLEAMQEHQVTAAGVRYPLEEPFFVLATKNPVEMEGTYPLPEAQLDRFMFDIRIDYLSEDDEVAVVTSTTSKRPEPIEALFSGEDLLAFHVDVTHPLVDPHHLVEEGDADLEARAGAAEHFLRFVGIVDRDDFAEPQHHGLARLGHDREGAADQEQHDRRQHGEHDRIAQREAHWPPPWAERGWASMVVGRFGRTAGSGR